MEVYFLLENEGEEKRNPDLVQDLPDIPVPFFLLQGVTVYNSIYIHFYYSNPLLLASGGTTQLKVLTEHRNLLKTVYVCIYIIFYQSNPPPPKRHFCFHVKTHHYFHTVHCHTHVVILSYTTA